MSNGNGTRASRKSRTRPPKGSRTTPMPGMVDADQNADARQSPSAFTSHDPTWWTNANEWLRGKGELLWENRLVPFLSWLGAVPERLGGAWGSRVRLPHRRLRGSSLGQWSWDEHGLRLLQRMGRFVMLACVSAVAVVLLSALAVHVASAFAHSPAPLNNISATNQPATATPTPNPAITIHVNTGSFTPPPAPAYTLGMWTSDNSPPVGGAVIVYARISQQGLPVPNIDVSFSVYGHTQHGKTDADGIATITVNATSISEQPVLIDGKATANGLDMTAQTFFTPI